jgi:hypothetical protein
MSDLRPNTSASTPAYADPHEAKPRPLKDRKQASQYLTENHGPVTVARLSGLASEGAGPPYRMFARRAWYEPDDLDAWWASVLASKEKRTSHAANPENAGAAAMAVARHKAREVAARAKATPAAERKAKPKPNKVRASADATS